MRVKKDLSNWVLALDRLAGRGITRLVNTYRHARDERKLHAYLKEKFGDNFQEVEPGPVAPAWIIEQTALLRPEDAATQNKEAVFIRSGRSAIYGWLKLLESYSFDLEKCSCIMEFGCGGARIIRHLRPMKDVRLIGTDVKAEFIDWCSANIAGIDFLKNDNVPPIHEISDESVDLVFANSVFTHIHSELIGRWICELHRIIKPGGYALVNMLTESHGKFLLDDDDFDELGREGELNISASSQKASWSTRKAGSFDTYLSESVSRQLFMEYFEILDVRPGFLDLYVLRKRHGPS